MPILIAGLIAFFGVHTISIVNRPLRDRIVARIGEGPWRGLYSLVALGGFAAIVWGYGLARQSPTIVYAPPLWARHVTLLLMVPVFPLLLAAYLPGRIRTATKHPMLFATKLWALGHLLSNGALADLLLFGAFLAWAGVDRVSLKRRGAKPPAGLTSSSRNDAVAVVVGLALYVAFVLGGHFHVIGVPASRWVLF